MSTTRNLEPFSCKSFVMIQSPSFALGSHIFSIFSITIVSVSFFSGVSSRSAAYSCVTASARCSHTSHLMNLTSDFTARAIGLLGLASAHATRPAMAMDAAMVVTARRAFARLDGIARLKLRTRGGV